LVNKKLTFPAAWKVKVVTTDIRWWKIKKMLWKELKICTPLLVSAFTVCTVSPEGI